MTDAKLLKLFTFYDENLAATVGVPPEETPDRPLSAGHLRYMCRTAALELVPKGRIEKAMRWLGFIQAAMTANGYFTLDELKKHSMPATDEPFVLERTEAWQAKWDAFTAEVEAVCDMTGCRVSVCEGGGPENLAATLAVTVHKLKNENRKLRDLVGLEEGEALVSVDAKAGSYLCNRAGGQRSRRWPQPPEAPT